MDKNLAEDSLKTADFRENLVDFAEFWYARVNNISNIEKYGQYLGKDGQLFLTDAKTINRLDLTTKSGLQNAEKVLGLLVGRATK